MKYNKLVRDKIPVVLKAEGKTVRSHIASDDEYWDKLKHKLKEEAAEFFHAESVEELADVIEVIEAIVAFKKIDNEALEQLRQQKNTDRGAFKDRIILDEVLD